jgi:arylsulfatase A-like enzyme
MLVIVGVGLSIVCSPGEDKPYNLVLITVDTLRPDRLGFGGNNRETSPTLDKLAAEGVVFPNAYSVAGWTLPSVATILTGRYPKDHGATDFHLSLDMHVPTLAGILRRNGYDTRGYVSHVTLTPTFGIADGFIKFDFSVLDIGHPHDVATARQLTDLALDEIGTIEKPYFLWVHYFDPHFEYLAHPPYASFGSRDIDRYDGETGHTDYYISKLLRGLPDKKNTIVVFTADHGEEFGEHGGQFHYTLHREVMRVPFVIKAPFLEPAVSQVAVEQIDVLPTVLSMLNMEVPGDLPGKDILAEAADRRKPIYLERDRPPPYRQRGVIKDGYKLVFVEMEDIEKIPAGSRGTHIRVRNVFTGTYMYDLNKDPGETRNIYDESDPRALEMLGLIATHFSRRNNTQTEIQLDDDLLKKLRSLGYLK